MAKPSNSDYDEDGQIDHLLNDTLSHALSSLLHLRITENGKDHRNENVVVDTMKVALRAICAVRESTKHQNEALIQLQEAIESKDKNVKEIERLLKEIVALMRELRVDLAQVQSKLAMQESTLAEFKLSDSIPRNGVLMWEITGYSGKKRDAKSGGRTSFYSEDFFSDPYGYRMCARVYLNGDGVGKNTHLSIFFAIKKGKYDDILKWPFDMRVQFSLLNQNGGEHLTDAFRPDPTSSSFRKPISDLNIASGCPMFASQQIVETRGYLKNNRIWVKVTVGN